MVYKNKLCQVFTVQSVLDTVTQVTYVKDGRGESFSEKNQIILRNRIIFFAEFSQQSSHLFLNCPFFEGCISDNSSETIFKLVEINTDFTQSCK